MSLIKLSKQMPISKFFELFKHTPIMLNILKRLHIYGIMSIVEALSSSKSAKMNGFTIKFLISYDNHAAEYHLVQWSPGAFHPLIINRIHHSIQEKNSPQIREFYNKRLCDEKGYSRVIGDSRHAGTEMMWNVQPQILKGVNFCHASITWTSLTVLYPETHEICSYTPRNMIFSMIKTQLGKSFATGLASQTENLAILHGCFIRSLMHPPGCYCLPPKNIMINGVQYQSYHDDRSIQYRISKPDGDHRIMLWPTEQDDKLHY